MTGKTSQDRLIHRINALAIQGDAKAVLSIIESTGADSFLRAVNRSPECRATMERLYPENTHLKAIMEGAA